MDLGNIGEEPILLFGGPYSNLDALLALKENAEALYIPPERIICTGDIVAYCGQPYETVETIRDWGIHVIMGNCEESFATKAEDCGCGFDEGSSCDLLSAQWFQFANKQLNENQRKWFSKLPRTLYFQINNKKCQVIHGSLNSINQFIFPSNTDTEFRHQLSLSNADIIIGGHSGLPFSKIIDKKLWHNAGAIGMPANDGKSNTWYSLLSAEKTVITIETCKLDYNHQQASNKMLAAGLDNGYRQALNDGYWPSMDVLPQKEKSQQGQALQKSITKY
ncbi:MAG: metallophosphoesterase family protein [Cellvibrionaceae bacterium]